ncbi:hypothetical protein HC928_25820 [bacterium]|nr:hypothetical protein [bacterium]
MLSSAIAGAILLAFSLIIVKFAIYSFAKELEEEWVSIIPFPYSDISTFAFVLGCLTWFPLNYFFNRDKEVRRVIQESNDFLEILLEKALSETKLISVTLKSGKVYIGFVTSNFDPSYDRKFLKLLPLKSGYREPVEKTLIITTDYSCVYVALAEKEREPAEKTLIITTDYSPVYETLAEKERYSDFEIIISVPEVQTVNIFDPDAYTLFNSPASVIIKSC